MNMIKNIVLTGATLFGYGVIGGLAGYTAYVIIDNVTDAIEDRRIEKKNLKNKQQVTFLHTSSFIGKSPN